MSVLRRLITAIEAKVDQSGFAKADKHIDGLARGFEKVGRTADRLTGRIQGAIAAFAGFTAFKGLVDTNVEAQKLAAQLKAVTGSAKAGADAFAFIQEFAKTTPFELNNVTTAFVKLKAAGIEPTAKTMKAVGDLAAANSTTIAQAASAITKANKGLVEEAGSQLNIAGKVSKNAVDFTVQGVEHKVKRSGQNIADFLIGVGETKFAGAMADQMETVGGKLSNLSDATTAFKVRVGESGLNGAITRLVDKLIEWTNASDGLAVKLGEGLGAAVDKLAASMEFLAKHSAEAQAAVAGIAAAFAGAKIAGFISSIGSALASLSGLNVGVFLVEILEWLKTIQFLGAGASALIGAVVIAFAGLATGIAEGIGLERIMELVTSIASFVTDVIGGIVSAVQRIGSAIFTAIFEPARAVGQVIGEILGVFIGPLSAAIEWVGDMFGWLLEVVGDIGVFIADLAGGALMVVAKVIRVIFQLIKKGFDGIVWVLEELGIIDMIKAAWDLLKQVIDWFKDALQKVGDWFRDMFAMLFNPILEIISDSINRLKKIIRALPAGMLGDDISEWAAKDSDFSIKTSDQIRQERERAEAFQGFVSGMAGSGPTGPAFDVDAIAAGFQGKSMSQVINAGGITINVTAADNSPAEIANATKDGTNEALSHFAADIVGVQ